MPQDAQNISFSNIFIAKSELYKTVNNNHSFQSFDMVFQHQFYGAQKYSLPLLSFVYKILEMVSWCHLQCFKKKKTTTAASALADLPAIARITCCSQRLLLHWGLKLTEEAKTKGGNSCKPAVPGINQEGNEKPSVCHKLYNSQ